LPFEYVIPALIGILILITASIVSILLTYITRNSLLTNITRSELKSDNIKTELDALKADVVRLSNDTNDHVLKKIKQIESDQASWIIKVETLDNSVKNFYSKWARRLGKIAGDDTAELEEETPPVIKVPNQVDFTAQNESVEARMKRKKKLKLG